MADTLATLAYPTIKQDGNPPEPLSEAGGDVIAFDRSANQLVLGPSHAFTRTTDLMVANGLIRFWVGNARIPAFINVEAFTEGAWRAVGYVFFSPNVEPLESARLVWVTPDETTVALDVRSMSTIYLTLKRGERGIRIQHGDGIDPVVETERLVQWAGLPPYLAINNVERVAGVYDSGMKIQRKHPARFRWPGDLSPREWSARVDYLMLLGTAFSELDEWGGSTGLWGDGVWGGYLSPGTGVGLIGIEDSLGVIGQVRLDVGADSRVRFELGSQSIESPALLGLNAGDRLRVCARFSEEAGMALSVRVAEGDVSHVSDSAAVESGTDDDVYLAFRVGVPTDDPNYIAGTYDQAMLLRERLTDADAADLLEQTSRTAGIAPIGRMVWFAPFDVDFAPSVAATDDGAVESATNPYGLRLVVVSLRQASQEAVGLLKTAEVFEAGAYVAVEDAIGDSLSGIHSQFAGDSHQQTRLR